MNEPALRFEKYDQTSMEESNSLSVGAKSQSTQPARNYDSPGDSSKSHVSQARPTPSSLGWDLITWSPGDFYELKLPTKDSGIKEPYLELKEGYPPSRFTPLIVYLDQSM